MAVKYKAKAFRLSNRLTYVIGTASAATGIPEAQILDECAARHILKCASKAAAGRAAKLAAKTVSKIETLLSTLEDTGKYHPRPKRLRPEVVDAIVGASKAGLIPQTDILEQSLESEVAGVVYDLVLNREQIADQETWRNLSEDAIRRGAVPNGSRRTVWESARFDKAHRKTISARKAVRPKLSEVASGSANVPGLGRVKNSNG